MRVLAHDGTTSTSAPATGRRVAAFAGISTLVGGVGHAALTGHLAILPMLLLLVAATAYGRVLAGSRIDAVGATCGVVALQGLLHLGMLLAGSGSGHAAAQAHAHAHGSGIAASAGVSVSMLVVHLVATVLGVIVLLALEARAWRVATELVARVGRVLRALVHRDSRSAARLSVAVGACRDLDLRSQLLVRGESRRGPPALRIA